MKKITFMNLVVVLFLMLTTLSFSQVELIDSFADKNYTVNPIWTGDASSWQIITNGVLSDGVSGTYTLGLNAGSNIAGTAFLTTPRESWGTEQSWGFWIGRKNQPFDFSNQSYFWLWANNQNLRAHGVDGYRLRFGDYNGEVKIIFERVDNLVPTQIFTSIVSIPPGLINIGILVWVVRFENSNWQIFTSPLPTTSGSGVPATQVPYMTSATEFIGEFTENKYTDFTGGYFGVMAKYSLTPEATTAAEFDQIYFSEVALSLLPVELSSFTGNYKNNSVNLNWETKTEVNNYGFEVERCESLLNNQSWGKIGFVAGSGNSNSPKEYSFTDSEISFGKYFYRLKQIDNDGAYDYSNIVEVNAGNMASDFVLNQNYPNPFNPSTKINFAVKTSQEVKVKVYNILGSLVAVLFNGKAEAGMVYQVEFDGNKLTSGIYVYQLETSSIIESKKMLLIK